MSSTEFTNEKVFKHLLGTITLLNDTNYAFWKADCEQVLHGIKAWRIVTEGEAQPENPKGMTKAAIYRRKAYADFTTRKAQAGAIIYGSCSPEVKTPLNQVQDPVMMWGILKVQMDTANTTFGRLTLFRQFSQLRPVPGQPISSYFSQLVNITNQLAGTPEAIPDMVLKNHTSGKKNSALCACTGIQRIERFQRYLPLVNDGALRGRRCNVRSARGRLDAPSSFTRRRALISANSLLRTIFSTCRRYSWRGDDDSHHLPLHTEVR